MKLASKTYYNFAQQAEQLMEEEKDEQKKKEYRKVAGQNYFYSAVEAIEGILKTAGVDLYAINNHNDRLTIVKKNSLLFKEAANLILKLEIMINHDYRRKVAYKGENSNKFLLVKELAEICQNEIN
ncbi:MAG: hypothetical protein ABIA37_04855 [Candidatus Woesearchaeota archaeon]